MLKKIAFGSVGLLLLVSPLAVLAQTDDTPTSPENDAVYCPHLVQTLQKGSRDATTVPRGQVTELQIFLTDYYNLNENILVGGYFGNLTKQYVIKFQTEQGLPAYGIVGSLTRARIAQVCSEGQTLTPNTGDQVQAQDIVVGTGKEAVSGSKVSVTYVGKLTNGTVFDSSAAHGNQPLVFTLGAQGIISGFQIGVNGMKEGGERLVSVPPSLGYGSQDVKDTQGNITIPANSTLIFDIKLISVNGETTPPPPPNPGITVTKPGFDYGYMVGGPINVQWTDSGGDGRQYYITLWAYPFPTGGNGWELAGAAGGGDWHQGPVSGTNFQGTIPSVASPGTYQIRVCRLGEAVCGTSPKVTVLPQLPNPPSPQKCGVNTFYVSNMCDGGYRNAYYQCYDGTSGVLGEQSSCKSSDVWNQYANQMCAGHCTPNQPTTPITVNAPNGGEQWEEGVLNSITWAPYNYNPDVNPSRSVDAYLETKNPDGTFTTLGSVIPSGKASIHWMTGFIDPYYYRTPDDKGTGQYGLVPPGNNYYVRVVNRETGAFDRSNSPFTILPKRLDLKVNGSDGPVTINPSQSISLSWNASSGLANCFLTGSISAPSFPIPVANSGTATYAPNFSGQSQGQISIACRPAPLSDGDPYPIDASGNGSSVTDSVTMLSSGVPQPVASLQVLSPNGGEVIAPNSPTNVNPWNIRWRQQGLTNPIAIALYKDDKWFTWITKSAYFDKSADDTYSFGWNIMENTGTDTHLHIPDLDSIAHWKIYITGQKADSTGYVDDKSDAPFSFASGAQTSGVLSVSTDASSPPYQIVTGGATGVTLGVYKLRATGEAIIVNKLNTFLSNDNSASGNPLNIKQLYVYSGSTLIGSGIFAGLGQNSTITLSSPLQVPKDTDSLITIRADLASIGFAQPGVPGSLIRLILASAEGTGASSGQYIGGNNNESGKYGSPIAGVRIFKSYPTVALDTLPSTGLADGRLLRFKITANPAGPVQLGRFALGMSCVNVTESNPGIYAYMDSSYSNPIPGRIAGQLGLAPTGCIPGTYNVAPIPPVDTSSPVVIPAGQTYYFEVRANVSLAGSNASAVTTLLGDASSAAIASLGSVNGNFGWSGNSLATSAYMDADWTNGYGVPGLPVSGLTQTRSSAGGTPTPPQPPVTPITAITSRSAFWTNMYTCVLGRNPNQQELNYWISQSWTITLPDAFSNFFNSQEYMNRNTSDQTFVNQLYQCVLFRQADQNGLNYWLSQLNYMSRGTLVTLFTSSSEFQTNIAPTLTSVLKSGEGNASANDALSQLASALFALQALIAKLKGQ